MYTPSYNYKYNQQILTDHLYLVHLIVYQKNVDSASQYDRFLLFIDKYKNSMDNCTIKKEIEL